MTIGKLYGVGLGPGDPELVTLKAARIIGTAPVVAYPAPEESDSFARAIAAPYIASGAIEIAIRVPMDVARHPAQAAYDAAALVIAEHLRSGRDVALLCQGDPFFYGSFMYLFGRLADRFHIEIIPGVTSLTACAAAARLPLLARSDTLAILPATLSDDALAARLAAADAAAILKLGRHGGRILALLERLGLAEQAWYVERASLPEQFVCRLSELGDRTVPYFAMILTHARGTALA